MKTDPTRLPPVIDMTPDGAFRTAPPGTRTPLSFKLLLGATIITVLAGAAAIAALALWFVALLLPVAIIAAGVAWATLRYRRWRRGPAGGSRSLYPR